MRELNGLDPSHADDQGRAEKIDAIHIAGTTWLLTEWASPSSPSLVLILLVGLSRRFTTWLEHTLA